MAKGDGLDMSAIALLRASLELQAEHGDDVDKYIRSLPELIEQAKTNSVSD